MSRSNLVNALMLVLPVLIVPSVFAGTTPRFATGPLRPFNTHDYDVDIRTDEFVILDISLENQILAFRHVYTKLDATLEGAPSTANCSYPGMKKHPHSGVVLGVYDLAKVQLKKCFVIYRAATTTNECSDFEEGVENLDEAKAYIRSYGMRVDAKPSPIHSDDHGEFVVKNHNHIFSIQTSTRRASGTDWREDPVLSRLDPSDSVISSTTLGQATVRGKVVYRTYYGDSWSMGSGGRVDFPMLFTDGSRVVLAERFRHKTGHFGMTDREVYNFSPVLDVRQIVGGEDGTRTKLDSDG